MGLGDQGQAGRSVNGEIPPSRARRLTIRRGDPQDLEAVAQLVCLAGGRDYPSHLIARLVDGLDPGAYCAWIAFGNGTPVGLTMLEVRTLRWAGRDYRAGYWTNLFVHPDYRATTLYPRLALAMFRGAEEVGLDVIYAAIRRRNVAQAHLALGMQKIGELPVLAKPLRPFRLMAKYRNLGRKAAWLSGIPDRLYGAYLLLRRRRVPPDVVLEELPLDSTGAAKLLDLLEASLSNYVHQPWTAQALRRRYEMNLDEVPYVGLKVQRRGRFVAGAVYRMAERNSGIRAGVVMEVVHSRDDPAAVRACLLEVERRAYLAGAEVLLGLPGWGEQAHALMSGAGYMRSPETYTLMWRRTGGEVGDLPVTDASRWRFSFVDHDAF